MPNTIQIIVNGKAHTVPAEPDRSLLTILRDELDMTGSKYGCGEGQCGACTILLDGRPLRSCITMLSGVAKRQITTIEGLEKDGKLHPVQEAFLEDDALQCGYCTSGMIMSAVALLQKNQGPSETEILRAMQGNVCRCGTYRRIVRAVQKASQAKGRAEK
ncbi:MAG TPA: (2Fe-2S)-binding protein [Chthonomonadaceae bacterium]|nr:(2Fe-2S)-binding protein [Chthonomonadaceae bacterium]